jgi:ferredoxin-NADP reductase
VRIRNTVDATLGRVTMYRLVVICLGLLVALAFALSFAGVLYYEPADLAATLAVLLAVTYGSNRLYGAMFGVHPHAESGLITAGLLFFLLWPSTEPLELLAIALAAAAASASKYLIAYRGRHIVNPAAAGVLFVTLLQLSGGVWWVATAPMLPAVAGLALVVAYRTRRLPVVALFVAVAGALMVGFRLADGDAAADAIEYAFVTTPVVFFAGFMLTEPLTLPPTRRQQLAVAAGVAVLFALPTLVGIDLGFVALTPELALIIGNVAAFLLGQRRGIGLTLTGKRSFGPTTAEFTFTPDAPVRFKPGQYLELTLPHGRADSRGTRRVFSIASADTSGETVSVGIKIPADGASSFKRELADLPTGTHLRATTVGGDFVLPADPAQPLLLVAGGIGITPFLSQLAECARTGRDVALVYGVTDPAEIPYSGELAAFGIPVVLAVPGSPQGVPDGWRLVDGFLSADVLRSVVPDLRSRVAYVSGPPAMVNALSDALREQGARGVKTDAFIGY